MEQILRTAERQAWASRIERPYEVPTPFEGEEYALLLVLHDESISPDEQFEISKQIVRSGCRYAVCWGNECSSWDDSIDMAFISSDPDYDPPDSKHVMTTWHEDESIEEVAEFFASNARFDGFEPRRFMVLCLGGGEDDYARGRDAVMDVLGGPTS